MKFFCIGDLHIKVENLDRVASLETQVEQHLQKLEGDYIIVILGDVLHTHERLHTIALNRAYTFIEKMLQYAPVYVLVGNHDYIENNQFLSENHWMNALKKWPKLTIVDHVVEFCARANELVLFTPFIPAGRFKEALNTRANWEHAKLIFAHQEFKGAQMKQYRSTEGDEWSADLPLVVSGHIHGRQTLEGVYYVGEPYEHGISIIDITGKIDTLALAFERKSVVHIDISEYKTIKPTSNLKVIISGSYEEYKIVRKTDEFQQLAKMCQIVFKPTMRAEIARAPVHSFSDLLYEKVISKKCRHLYCAYQCVMNDRVVLDSDVCFIDLN